MESGVVHNFSGPYDRLVDKYDNEEGMMNEEGLNYEDIYDDPPHEPELGEFIDGDDEGRAD